MHLTTRNNLRLLSVVGARPQFVKLGPVSRAIAAYNSSGRGHLDDFVVHTGQHYDSDMSDIFFEELQLPRPGAHLGIGSGSHGQQTGRMLESIEALIQQRRPDWLIVYGDTNSTLAGALAAAKLHLRIAHVEAGLRSWNRAMPEEINRIVTDHVSDVLLAPTLTAVANLEREALGAKTVFTGDVMYDAVLHNKKIAARRSTVLQRMGIAGSAFGLLTIHRADNTEATALRGLITTLSAIADSFVPLVMPVHPRTRHVLSNQLGDVQLSPRLRLMDPVGYLDMLSLIDGCSVVLTDSGGLQKEAFFMDRPCVTLRTETEWIETVAAGANTVVGTSGKAIHDAVAHWLSIPHGTHSFADASQNAFGGGDAGVRIVQAIVDH